MRFIALLEDRPNTAEIRAANTAAHEEFLRRHKGTIVMAGGLRETPDGAPLGGLWLFEAESREAVEAIIAEDPYMKVDMRASVRVLNWSTAPGFEDMRVISGN